MLEFMPDETQVLSVQQQLESWQLPKPEFIKVNFDVAYCQETHEDAWGFIARADDGTFIVAGAGRMSHLSSALHAEASACVAAIERTSNMGAFRVTFGLDSLNLVNALKTGDRYRGALP
ncbi:hypothetical protein QYE76_020442 [Lolium multiflorum]|uniref:RNase H type-1 domain-containing protein n=1 Tax=Lolium multiflorum TaxID=4521 RepID=A0AAD8R4U2_LOLMU|nr:hypothetical protein QYE76_020442 [Lolium multiflorum]